ncbi:MAG TPA: hypothetical protein VGR95_16130, partial [Thermoanaerobaculia bacterium]|nr:hypothetical protein [Thermoanaerobaculia bacterium]
EDEDRHDGEQTEIGKQIDLHNSGERAQGEGARSRVFLPQGKNVVIPEDGVGLAVLERPDAFERPERPTPADDRHVDLLKLDHLADLFGQAHRHPLPPKLALPPRVGG